MLANYLKVALKVLLRRKFFTVISLFGISFTLMVLMVASGIMDQLFGEHAPESHRSRTLALYEVRLTGPRGTMSTSAGWYLLDRFVRNLPHVEETSFFSESQSVASYVDGRKIVSTLKRTDGAFWRLFEFDFVEGDAFTDDDGAGGRFVAVINETTRERFFGRGPAVGRDLTADAQTFRVVGVVRDVSVLHELPFAEIWVPLQTTKSSTYRHAWHGNLNAALLARSAADFPEIRAELRSRLDAVELPNPEEYNRVSTMLETRFDHASYDMIGDGELHPTMLRVAIVVAMLLFMVLPAVNLVNLNLSRILERGSEIGVRKSFGASSSALVGQFLVENVVLTLIGGALGLALSALVLGVLNDVGSIPYAHFRLNPRVFLYGLVLALVFGLVSGVYPAWRMSRMNPVEALRGRSS